jgi:hypothetical protein
VEGGGAGRSSGYRRWSKDEGSSGLRVRCARRSLWSALHQRRFWGRLGRQHGPFVAVLSRLQSGIRPQLGGNPGGSPSQSMSYALRVGFLSPTGLPDKREVGSQLYPGPFFGSRDPAAAVNSLRRLCCASRMPVVAVRVAVDPASSRIRAASVCLMGHPDGIKVLVTPRAHHVPT